MIFGVFFARFDPAKKVTESASVAPRGEAGSPPSPARPRTPDGWPSPWRVFPGPSQPSWLCHLAVGLPPGTPHGGKEPGVIGVAHLFGAYDKLLAIGTAGEEFVGSGGRAIRARPDGPAGPSPE